jgi:hypothetical protein
LQPAKKLFRIPAPLEQRAGVLDPCVSLPRTAVMIRK